jgi:hypothetical protein
LTAGLLVPALWALLSGAARVDKLPDWAAGAVRDAEAHPAPSGADAWVLVQRTELVYAGEGKVRARLQRVVRVESERGLGEAALLVPGLAGKGSRLKRLKGWNARPDGEVEELSRDDVVSLEDGQSRVSAAAFARAMKGSVIAFECVLETEHPMGPVEVLPVMEAEPIRQWSLTTRSERPAVELRVDMRHASPWLAQSGAVAGGLSFREVPGRPKDELAAPADRNALPWVQVRFLDPSLPADRPSSATWDALATWTHAQYTGRLVAARQSGGGGEDERAALRAIHDWMTAEMTYRQVYLTPERGWIPSPADEVARRRYGDCKDLATLVISDARAAGLRAYPALARVFDGQIEESEPPSVFAFNHVIVALKLSASLGLPAELEAPEGRFLLIDPTARLTPFGRLTDAHAGRRLLVCTEKGGVWITVPVEATQSAQTRFALDGTLVKPTSFTGTLEVREDGVLDGLRAAEIAGGLEALRKACLRLGLPTDARCEVKAHSSPLRLEEPYTVLFTLEFDGAVRTAGTGEWTLDLPGLPRLPRSIARAGRPRSLPVAFENRGALELDAHLRAPWLFAPVAPGERGDTPFRTYEWKTLVRPTDEGSEIEFRLLQQLRPGSFDFDRREEGVAAWRKDRAAVQRLLDTALALKVE